MAELPPVQIVAAKDDVPPPYLTDNVVHNLLLCLAPEPAYLAVATAVSTKWRSVVHSEACFGRRFRLDYDGPTPLLGFFSNNAAGPFFTATGAGVVGLAPPEEAVSAGDGSVQHIYDARHGRVLMDGREDKELLVWDPLSRRKDFIPMPPGYFVGEGYGGGALICEADHDAGDDCHAAPYRVVFVYCGSDRPPTTMASVYSSRTNTWGPVATMDARVTFELKQPAVLDYTVYWLVNGRTQIIEFEFDTNSLALFRTPVDLPDFVVFPMEDGRLGYTGMMGPIVRVFAIEDIYEDGDATWTKVTTLHLDAMRPSQSYQQVLDSDTDSDSDDEEEFVLLLAHQFGPKAKKDSKIIPSHPPTIKSDNDEYNHVVIRPRVIGFIEDPNSILVRTELGVFMVDIESNEYEQLSQRIYFTTVYPYESFYTTVGKANFNDPVLIDHENNDEQGLQQLEPLNDTILPDQENIGGGISASGDGDEQ
uniref:F-box domain-containing protein n=1 Tax=Oryza glumipatula TaxID=40148 RepID=A0A0E0B7Q3_9ORYZ